jgi:S-adenosylmethionine decarboxylase
VKREALPDGATRAPATVHAPTGIHVLADLSGIAADKLSDCAQLESLLRAAAEAAHARVLFSHFHGFGEGQGVTGVVLLAESHITIHTWPECGFAAADIFMCGSAEPKLALTLIESALQPQATHIHTARRGPP